MKIGGIEFPDNPTDEDFRRLAKEWCDFRGIFTGAGNDICLANLLCEVWQRKVDTNLPGITDGQLLKLVATLLRKVEKSCSGVFHDFELSRDADMTNEQIRSIKDTIVKQTGINGKIHGGVDSHYIHDTVLLRFLAGILDGGAKE